MIHVKKGLNVMSISITICTILSAILCLIFARGGFYLINPYRIQLSNPIYNACISLIIYAFFGLFIYTTVELFKNEKLGFTKITGLHFVVSVLIFSFLGMATSFPIGLPMRYMKSYYIDSTDDLLIVPIIISFVGYIVIYLVMWFYYFYQIKKINTRL